MKYPVGTKFKLGGVEGEVVDYDDNNDYKILWPDWSACVIPQLVFDSFTLEIIEPEVRFTKAQAEAIKDQIDYGTLTYEWVNSHTDKD